MKCALALFNSQIIDCLKSECAVWDSDHNTCLISNFLDGYINQQRITVEMLKLTRKFEKQIDNHEE